MQFKGMYSVYGYFHVTIQSLWMSEKGFRDQMLSIDYNRTSNVFVDVYKRPHKESQFQYSSNFG